MKTVSLRIIFLLTAWAMLAFSTPSYSSEPQTGLSEGTQKSIGCLSLASVALLASVWAGPSEMIMIAAGGLLVPSGFTPLMVSLTATLGVLSCGVGYEATPAALWLAEQVGVIPANPNAAPDTGQRNIPSDTLLVINTKATP
jgi:hypothetical protein